MTAYRMVGGIIPAGVTPLDRLAYIGLQGMGALVFEPDYSVENTPEIINLDHLETQSQDVLSGTADDVLQALLKLNGSSAGARPKALIGVDQTRENIVHGVNKWPEIAKYYGVSKANIKRIQNKLERTSL